MNSQFILNFTIILSEIYLYVLLILFPFLLNQSVCSLINFNA